MTINEITLDFKAFWQPYFDKIGVPYPIFVAKQCYNSREPTVRFSVNELSSNKDVYVELYDANQHYYNPEYRELYKLVCDKNWTSKIEKYKRIFTSSDASILYSVKVEDLELVNRTSVTALFPDMSDLEGIISIFNFGDDISDNDERIISDAHYQQMTIKDLYCIINNVPLSEKVWLNNLIMKGIKWNQQQSYYPPHQ